MATQHSIAELLKAGAQPTKDEVRDLSDLGRFTAALITRYLSGLAGPRDDAASRHGAMVAALEGRLAHRGAGQWMEGMGLGAAQLADGWHGLWQMAAGASEGYQRLEISEMEVFQLLPDAIVAPYREAEMQSTHRRASLFGPRGRRSAPRSSAAPPRDALPLAALVELRNGGQISVAVLQALAEGGLPLADQLDLRRVAAPAGGVSAATKVGPAGSGRTGRPGRSGGAAARAGRQELGGIGTTTGSRAPAARSTGRVHLDGIQIDARTPALAGALSWAEQAFGRSAEAGAGLSVSRVGIERLLQGPARTLLDAGRGEVRPVFGFFDSVEGEFLSLEREPHPLSGVETPAAQRRDAARQPVRAMASAGQTSGQVTPGRALRATDRVIAGASPGPLRSQPPSVVAARGGAPVTTTRLSTLVPSPRGSAPVIRPESRGVFSNPLDPFRGAVPRTSGGERERGPREGASSTPETSAVWSERSGAGGRTPSAERGRPVAGMVATFEPGAIDRGAAALYADDVVYDGAGRPRARESRGALAAPRVRLRPDLGRPGSTESRRDFVTRGFEGLAEQGTDGVVVGSAARAAAGTSRVKSGLPAHSEDTGTRADMAPGAGGTEPGLSPVWAPGAASWRLADDLGRDLPLGAALSSYERLAGGLVHESAAFLGRAEPFRPVVAGAYADTGRAGGTGRRPRPGFPDSLDGLVWVALEQDSPATRTVEPHLTVIPTGRRAVMVPAAGALALNANVEARRATEALGRLEARGSALSLGASIAPRDARGAASAPAAGRGVGGRASSPLGVGGRSTGAGALPDAPAGARSESAQRGGPALAPSVRRGTLMPAGTLLADVQTGREPGLRTSRPLAARFVGEQVRDQVVGGGRAASVAAQVLGSAAAEFPTAPSVRPPSASRRVLEGPAGQPRTDWQAGARVARRALQRQSVTGREWLAAQSLVGAEGPIVAGAMAAASRRSVVEPALLPELDSRSSFASILGGNLPPDGGALMRRLMSLAPPDAVRVGRSLRAAGWAESELAMLELTTELGQEREPAGAAFVATTGAPPRVPGTGAARRSDAGAARQATAVGGAEAGAERGLGTPSRPRGPALVGTVLAAGEAAAAHSDGARAAIAGGRVRGGQIDRMARNLARILTGTAALGGGLVSGGRGSAPALSVDSLLGGALGVLGQRGASLDYFAGLAPVRGSDGARRGTLRDAIGELLSVARAELASGRAVEPALRASLTRQLSQLDSAWRAGSSYEPIGGRDTTELASGLATTSAATALTASRLRPDRSWLDAPPGGRVTAGGRPAWAGGSPGGYEETERLLVVPRADTASDTLADRLAMAIGHSSRGPAGVDRLTRVIAGGAATRAVTGTAPSGLGQRTPEVGTAQDGRGRAEVGAVGRGPGRRHDVPGRGFERRALGESVALSSVLAPEAMLGGLWSSVADDASVRAWRGESAGELTKIDQVTAAPEFDGLVRPDGLGRIARAAAPSDIGAGAGAAGSAMGSGEGRPGVARRRVARAGEGGRRELILARITRLLERAGVRSEAAQDLLVDSLSRNVGRGRQFVAREHGAMAEFSWAWLGRVDGSRSGIDLELQGDRDAFARAFSGMRGARGSSVERAPSLAEFSPIGDAGFVAPQSGAVPEVRAVEDRSGVRRVARAAGFGRSGASRPSHRAAEAAKQTNWRFVDTGSRASSAHADLGRLAATVLDSPDVGRRVPMPLVMPAVKAVAQSALREDASARGANVDGAKQRADQQAQQGQNAADSKAGAQLSDEALEALAHEFADRIARKMKREQERRGLCR
jgi:hypothetical protein